MKKYISAAAAVLLFSGLCAYGEENIIRVTNFYQSGTQYLNSDQYSKAIGEFKKALRENPADNSSRIQIINAYHARAAYYNNKVQDFKSAANDLRSALFYMKYYDVTPVDSQTLKNIQITEGNLENVLSSMNFDNSPKGRYAAAKQLRSQGEFAASVTEYMYAITDPKYKKESFLALGEIYYIMNLNQQAATYLQRALAEDSSNADAHLKLARIYEKMGNPDKAAKEYGMALTSSSENQEIISALENIWKQKVAASPDNAENHANLGAIYQKKGNLDAALEEYKLAEKLNPSNATTRLNLGTLYQQKKDYETAMEAYDSILKLYPNHAMAYFYKAQCLKAMGYKDAAIQNYKLAQNLEPNNTMIKNELFELYKTNMTPDDVLKYLGEEVKRVPNNADKLYEYAYELHKVKRLDEAITYYNQALKLSPSNADTYVNLGIAYTQKESYDKAKQIFEQGLSIYPENSELNKQLSILESASGNYYYTQATTLFNQKKYKEAIAMYGKVTPVSSESLVGIGACYQAMNNNKLALENYKKAYNLDSKNADIAYYIALVSSNENNNAEALSYAQKALAINPSHKNAKELMTYLQDEATAKELEDAIALYEKQEYTKSLEMFNKLIAKNPKDANAHYYCGLIYDDQKKYWQAIESYKKAIEADPAMNVAEYSIAVDYDYLGKYKEATSYYKKYLTTTKETNDYTAYATKRVQELKDYVTP